MSMDCGHNSFDVFYMLFSRGNSTLLSVIQEDQLDDGWSPVILTILQQIY